MYDFTTEDVVREVRHLAEQNPDFVYTKQDCFDEDYGACYYTSADGQGSGRGCIVGQALIRLGVPQEVLEDFDEDDGVSVNVVIDNILPLGSIHAPSVDWLGCVQAGQDMGYTWDDAVRRASNRARASGMPV